MTVDDAAWGRLVAEVVDGSHLGSAAELVAVVRRACARIGMDIDVCLADLAQRTLRPVGGGSPLDVDGTLAGRAFRRSELVLGAGDGGSEPDAPVVWIPVVNGTERLGVLCLRLRGVALDDDVRRWCWTLAGLVGHLVVAKMPYSDAFHVVRRSQPLTVASELLWQLLPPQTFASRSVVLAAVLEPFDQVAGDAFDYAVDEDRAYLAIFDATGHDLRAGLVASAALAATRNARRAGADLEGMAAAADAVLCAEMPDRFCTAVLATLQLDSGELRCLVAGHPPPIVIRNRQAVDVLDVRPRPPLGFPSPTGATGSVVARLEPGDRILLHSDGITEARDPDGRFFGLDRMVDLVERHESAGVSPPETLRRVVHAVLEHQRGRLQDDATLMLAEWSGTAAHSLLPPHIVAAASSDAGRRAEDSGDETADVPG